MGVFEELIISHVYIFHHTRPMDAELKLPNMKLFSMQTLKIIPALNRTRLRLGSFCIMIASFSSFLGHF